MIFEVHHIVFRYNVCPEEYMDLPLRLVSDIASKDIEPMRRMKKRGNQKNNSSIRHTKFATTLLLQSIQVFNIQRSCIFSHCKQCRA